MMTKNMNSNIQFSNELYVSLPKKVDKLSTMGGGLVLRLTLSFIKKKNT